MNGFATQRPPLTEAQQLQLAALVLLERMHGRGERFHAGLMDGDDDRFLEPVFDYMRGEGLVRIGDDDHYGVTDSGAAAHTRLLQQQQSYLAHFEVFARVDLALGTFADPDRDYLEDPRWTDLRVAVAEYKGIDPYRLVFGGLLAEDYFFANADWKVDLALGSPFFAELEEIVRSQVAVEELGYSDDDGLWISGEAVIEDVIIQGALENQRRYEVAARQAALFPDEAVTEASAEADEGELPPYDPAAPLSAYANSPTFVEPLWLTPYW